MNEDSDAPDDTYVRTHFLARIAHELRGPAGVIHGALHELEIALGSDSEKFRSLLSMADRGVKRLLRTAMLLEETSQFEQGKVEFTRVRCNVIDIVQHAALDAEALDSRRMIAVKVDAPSTPCFGNVDARWIAMALGEIFSNAIRHASAHVLVRVVCDSGMIRINCTDDNRSPRAFAPIRFREPNERRGHGLALAIARDVVAAHEGTIEIAMGDFGCSVTVQLPCQVEACAKATV